MAQDSSSVPTGYVILISKLFLVCLLLSHFFLFLAGFFFFNRQQRVGISEIWSLKLQIASLSSRRRYWVPFVAVYDSKDLQFSLIFI